MKKCSRCKTEKEPCQFNKTKSNKDGLSWLCRECNTESLRKWRAKNKDKFNDSQRNYRSTLDGFVVNAVSNAKSRAKRKGFDFGLTAGDVKALLDSQDMKCAVTGLDMVFDSSTRKKANPFRASIDRIDSNMGYTLDNIRLVCWAVNQMKADRTEEEFEFWINILHKTISSQA